MTVTFSEAMDAATIGAGTIELRNAATSALVAGSVSYNAATRVATLTPAAALAPATTYTASVKGGGSDPRVKDSAGNALAGTVSWSFTTAAPDTTPPTITARSPLMAPPACRSTAAVTLSFSEAMDAATVSGSTFVLRNAGGNVVAAGGDLQRRHPRGHADTERGLAPSEHLHRQRRSAVPPSRASKTWPAMRWPQRRAGASPPSSCPTPRRLPSAPRTPSSGATAWPRAASVVVTFSEPMDAASIAPGTIELRNTATSALVSADGHLRGSHADRNADTRRRAGASERLQRDGARWG